MRALVVGSGTIGLRTCIELLKQPEIKGVVLRSPVSPIHPSVCSMGAGGLWMPYHVGGGDENSRVTKWSQQTFEELWNIAMKKEKYVDTSSSSSQSLPLVEIMTAIQLHTSNENITSVTNDTNVTYLDKNKLPYWINSIDETKLQFQQLTIEMLYWQNIVTKLKLPTRTQEELMNAGYNHAYMFQTPIVNTPLMLKVTFKNIFCVTVLYIR